MIDPAVAELALAEARAKVASPIPSELLPAVRERGLTNHMDAFVVSEGRIPDELFLELWTAGAKLYSYDVDLSDYAVARFGERALEGLEWYLAGSFAYHDHVRAESLLGVDSARCTLPLARLALRIGHLRAVLATRWLRAHRETSAFVLGPAVVSGQRHFAPLFRELARGLDLERVLAPWGEEVTRAVLDWLAFDPRGFAPAKAPKMPPAWRPEALPRPTPRDGRALPLEAVRTIGVMLAISLPDALYAGLEDLKGVCEPRSLAELAWEIARAWEDAGARPGSAWMRDALVHLADDEVVRRTTPAMKVHHVLDALIQMGTPAAQMELATISACCAGKRPSWRDRAERGLEAIAARHGISKDEFDDALVPVAAVDARGELELDYGPRKIKVGFDAHLEPYTITAEGARSRALPPTRKRDDPDKVEEAKRIWLDLKEDVAVLAARRLRSLERAMCAGRRWSAEAFARAFLGSPLALHLARGLIWLAEPATLFRVAEDTTLAGADDERVILGERSVRVPHPMQMKPEALARWSEVLADYEIVQPFAQLARAVRGLPESAREDESDLVLEMSAKGWGRPSGQVRPLYQTPGHLHLHDQGSKIRLRFGHVSSPWKLERVVALDISEALYDLLG